MHSCATTPSCRSRRRYMKMSSDGSLAGSDIASAGGAMQAGLDPGRRLWRRPPIMASNEIEWRLSTGLTDYSTALSEMEQRAEAVHSGSAPELVWLLQHPPLYTAGTSADPAELFNPQGFPVYEAGRGGRYTYHGPGQRVGYLVMDL